MGLGVFCNSLRFVRVEGNRVIRLVEGRLFNSICADVGREMVREGWGASQRYEGRELDGGGGRGNLRHERVAFPGLDAIMLLVL